MKTNQDYKNAALAALKGNWAPAVLCAVLYLVIALCVGFFGELAEDTVMSDGIILVISLATLVLSVAFLLPLEVGYYNAHKELLLSGDTAMIGNMFRTGFSNWGRNIWGMFLVGLFTFLWMLLLIVPGIIKSFAYAMTPFILVDRPDLSANEAVDLSNMMMKGHKFDLFWLMLSFLGWIILAILTAGIGFFWLLPYMYASYAAFYEDVKADYEAKTATL